MRIAVLATAMCLSAVGLSVAADAEASIKKSTHIPAQGLGSALKALAKDRGFQVVFRSEVVGPARTRGASGELTTNEALAKLLEGTDLAYSYLDEKTVTIAPRAELESGSADTPESSHTRAGMSNDASDKDGKNGIFDRLRLAQTDQGTSQNPTSADSSNSKQSLNEPVKLDEIVVTAQKRGEERLQDTPVPVSVLNADVLAQTGQVLLKDYYASVPALSLSPNFAGQQMLSIRGVTTGGFTNPVVGVLIDDVPYGTSTFYAGNQVPDIDPDDLARIEVLRGPQGTLYGSNSMGGLLKFVTLDPSTEGYSGRFEAGTSHVYNGTEPGYNLRASANIPLGETFAMRASAFTRQDPGYIDNPVSNLKGVNETQSEGGRLAALWRPSKDFSLKLSALYQQSKANGSSDVNVPTAGFPQTAGLGDLQQNYINGVGGYDRKIQAYSATLNANLGGVQLASVTGYSVNDYSASLDFSSVFGPQVTNAYPGYGTLGSGYFDHDNITKFSEELRLSGSLWSNLEWLAGTFYTHENAPGFEFFSVQVPTTGQFVADYWNLPAPTEFAEKAVFGDLTYHFTDEFDVQIGGRQSWDTFTQLAKTQTGPFADPTSAFTPEYASNTDAFTYLLTPRYKVSSDVMVYARLASGFRPGGPNPASGVPPQYSADKTQNYELGLKGAFLERRLSIDASVYYINWKDIQVQQQTGDGHFTYETNGSGAKSEGVELSVSSTPLSGFTVAGWVAYDNAVLTENFPPGPAYGVAGDRLPNTSRWSGNVSLQQDFLLWSGATGFVAASASYVGDRLSVFLGCSDPTPTGACPNPPTRQQFPAYTKTDLRAGVNDGSWTVSVYATNVGNVRGLLNGGAGFDPVFARVYIPPRTVGLNVVERF